MKKRLQGMIMGFLLAGVVTSTAVYARTGENAVKIFYNNIKVYVDGAVVVPKDGTGKSVEPFTMNGTTYLPVRALGDALGKDVIWDGATQSVYLGRKDQNKPDNYLDKVQYSDYASGVTSNTISKINSKITDHSNVDYKNGMLFTMNGWDHNTIKDDSDNAHTTIVYPLNSQYRKLSGKIVLPKLIDGEKIYDAKETDAVTVYFYADGRLLHTANSVTGSMPFNFDLNISGVNSLEIKLKSSSLSKNHIALTDLALYK